MAKSASWKPISKLTDEEYEKSMSSRVLLYNSCNGPALLKYSDISYFSAQDIKDEGVWDKYMVLPEAD